jgi:glucokinase
VRILAGDIGGTKTLLAILEKSADGWRTHRERLIPSRNINVFTDSLETFLEEAPGDVETAAFGVPGPVVGRRAQGTNLPWPVDGEEIERRLGIGRVVVLNDFAAQALGILELGPGELEPLNPGADPPDPGAPAAVIGAGTGLGEAILVSVDGRPRAFGTEGGHADFAPRTDDEVGLHRFLRARFGHVSTERVLSGDGLSSIYAFLRAGGRFPEDARVRAAIASAPDPAPAISGAALDGGDPLASAALDLFVDVYGAEAGNMALRLLARGGVYVTGGIATKILPRLREGGFLAAFRDKGRLGDFVRRLPVNVVLNPRAGLLGAAAEGLRSQEG